MLPLKTLELPYCPPGWENISFGSNHDLANLGVENLTALQGHLMNEQKYWRDFLDANTNHIDSLRTMVKDLRVDVPKVQEALEVFDHTAKYVMQLSDTLRTIDSLLNEYANALKRLPLFAFERSSTYLKAGDKVVFYVSEKAPANPRRYKLQKEVMKSFLTGEVMQEPTTIGGRTILTIIADRIIFDDKLCADRRLYLALDSPRLLSLEDAQYFKRRPDRYKEWIVAHERIEVEAAPADLEKLMRDANFPSSSSVEKEKEG